MATYDLTEGKIGANIYSPNRFSVVEHLLDFPAIVAKRLADGRTALAANDVLQVIPVEAGHWVLEVSADVETAEGEAATFDIGDGTDVDGFIDGADANAAGKNNSLITTAFSVATAAGKRYTAADTIDVTLLTATFNLAKIRLYATVIDLRPDKA